MGEVESYRRLVKYEDLNPAGCLFGGRLLEMVDEAAALYTICQLNTKNIVTVSMDKAVFRVPIKNGDFLKFICSTEKTGTSSLTVKVKVVRKDCTDGTALWTQEKVVFETTLVFVRIDPETGKSVPHGKIHNEPKF